MIGVVACEALYYAIERGDSSRCVEYVPQELHEFPTSVPDEAGIRTALQAAIDKVDRPECERIVVIYAADPARNAVQSTHAPIAFAPIEDCVSAFLDGPVLEATGERKSPDTFYLTRGTIECGVDAYKLYKAYTGEIPDLIERFERAQVRYPDLRIRWPAGERFSTAVERGRTQSTHGIERIFFDIVGSFERVVLLDTGGTYDFHRDYAASVREFIETLATIHGNGHAVELEVRQGDTTIIDRALDNDELSRLETYGFAIKRPRN